MLSQSQLIGRRSGVADKDSIQLFVNSSSSGEGENLAANYNAENLTISFNSRYLLDIASEIEDEYNYDFSRFCFSRSNSR